MHKIENPNIWQRIVSIELFCFVHARFRLQHAPTTIHQRYFCTPAAHLILSICLLNTILSILIRARTPRQSQ